MSEVVPRRYRAICMGTANGVSSFGNCLAIVIFGVIIQYAPTSRDPWRYCFVIPPAYTF